MNTMLTMVRSLTMESIVGIPEDSGLRATAWKVLMGYLPPDKQLWNATLLERRLSYYVRKHLYVVGGIA
jgi:hypothetical protein